MVRSKEDETYYFVLNTWEDVPVVYFIKRASEGAVELARVEVPKQLNHQLDQGQGIQRGIYAVEDRIRDWLKEELDA